MDNAVNVLHTPEDNQMAEHAAQTTAYQMPSSGLMELVKPVARS